MLAAVEPLPVGGVLEPEVGAGVDDQDVVAELFGDGCGRPVRQGEEDDVMTGQVGGGRVEHLGVRQRNQVRMMLDES